jgi:RecJ-like exonuclease
VTHAERVREAERAVVRAAEGQRFKAASVMRFTGGPLGRDNDYIGFTCQTNEAMETLHELIAQTCPECGGTGKVPEIEQCVGCDMKPCPAGCDAGRKRDGGGER